MAAVAEVAPAAPAPAARRRRPGGARSRARIAGATGRWLVLLIGAIYFLVPLIASLEFSLRGKGGHYSIDSYRHVFSQPDFGSSLWTSVKLGLMAVALMLVLLVPTMTLVQLRFPKARTAVETVTVLPLIIPPVVLVVGVLAGFSNGPEWLLGTPTILGFEYVILALPYAYRTLDAGMSAIDLRTLTEASRGLGASWPTTMLRVVLPNLRTAVLGAAVLTLALVLGEFAMASLLLFNTFPTWIVVVSQTEAGVSVAASLFALLITWVFLFILTLLGGGRGRRSGAVAVGAAAAPAASVQGTPAEGAHGG
jgi:putative spermidine/putrescine transport system permease protein